MAWQAVSLLGSVLKILAGDLPKGTVGTSQEHTTTRAIQAQAGLVPSRPWPWIARPDRDRTRGTRWPRFPHFFVARDRHSPRQSMSRHVFVFLIEVCFVTWAITGQRYKSGEIERARYSGQVCAPYLPQDTVQYKQDWGPRNEQTW
ncbi:hypothetical protein CI102_3818 [Trichoderma harzianum]|nr:hypothetical protein CI102_3818 [Trichoderma harzianum]